MLKTAQPVIGMDHTCILPPSSSNMPPLMSFLRNYLLLALLGLCGHLGFSLPVVRERYSLAAVHGLLIAAAAPVVEPGF